MQVKNVTNGPKVLNAIQPFTLGAGSNVDGVEISVVELASAKLTGWFEFSGDEPEKLGPDHDIEFDPDIDDAIVAVSDIDGDYTLQSGVSEQSDNAEFSGDEPEKPRRGRPPKSVG